MDDLSTGERKPEDDLSSSTERAYLIRKLPLEMTAHGQDAGKPSVPMAFRHRQQNIPAAHGARPRCRDCLGGLMCAALRLWYFVWHPL